jgi:hypothetical protein
VQALPLRGYFRQSGNIAETGLAPVCRSWGLEAWSRQPAADRDPQDKSACRDEFKKSMPAWLSLNFGKEAFEPDIENNTHIMLD